MILWKINLLRKKVDLSEKDSLSFIILDLTARYFRRLFQFPREVLSLPPHQQAQGN